jgi:hypothetical protein
MLMHIILVREDGRGVAVAAVAMLRVMDDMQLLSTCSRDVGEDPLGELRACGALVLASEGPFDEG